MKQPTKEEILEWLGEEDSNNKAWNHLFSVDFNDFVRKGICRLIEKVAEWQKEANQIMSYGKDQEQRLWQLEEFAREIRDFGKED